MCESLVFFKNEKRGVLKLKVSASKYKINKFFPKLLLEFVDPSHLIYMNSGQVNFSTKDNFFKFQFCIIVILIHTCEVVALLLAKYPLEKDEYLSSCSTCCKG